MGALVNVINMDIVDTTIGNYSIVFDSVPNSGSSWLDTQQVVVGQSYEILDEWLVLDSSTSMYTLQDSVLYYTYNKQGFHYDTVAGSIGWTLTSTSPDGIQFNKHCTVTMELGCDALYPAINQVKLGEQLVNYNINNDNVCLSCTSGATCGVGLPLQPNAVGVYYDTASSQFMQCDPIEICSDGACVEGYTGIRCGLCQVGYYRQSQKCVLCPVLNTGLIVAVFILVVLMFTFGMAFMIKRGINVAALRLLFDFGQYVFIFNAFSLKWPDVVVQFFSIFSFMNFNIEIASNLLIM